MSGMGEVFLGVGVAIATAAVTWFIAWMIVRK